MFRGQHPGAPGMGSRKLDRRFDALAAGGSEEGFVSRPPARCAKFFGQFPGEIRNVRLDHRRTAALQFSLQRAHHVRMVVANVVNAISGKKIENASSVRRKQLRSRRTARSGHSSAASPSSRTHSRIDTLARNGPADWADCSI